MEALGGVIISKHGERVMVEACPSDRKQNRGFDSQLCMPVFDMFKDLCVLGTYIPNHLYSNS